jgi:hypothetical protein
MNGDGYQDLHFRRGDPPVMLRTHPLPRRFRLDRRTAPCTALTETTPAATAADGVSRRLMVVRRRADGDPGGAEPCARPGGSAGATATETAGSDR